MRHFQPTALLFAVVFAGCPQPTAPALTAITLSPENARINRGASLDFVATGLFADGTVRDISTEVTWRVVDGFIGTIDTERPGRVHGVNVGSTKVRASLGGISKEQNVFVVGGSVVRLEVTPAIPVVPVGLSLQLVVNAIRGDGSVEDVTTAALYSVMGGATGVTMRDELPGVVIGAVPGVGEVLVSFDGVSQRVVVSVTDATIRQLTLSPANPSLPLGTTLELNATASLSDGRSLDVTEQVSWTSSAPNIVFVSTLASERGTLTARTIGVTEVHASLRGAEAATTVTVSDATLARVEVSPSQLTLAKGTQATLTAQAISSDGTRRDVTGLGMWTSDVPGTVSISSTGQARALEPGAAVLRFDFMGRFAVAPVTVTEAALVALEVTPSPLSLAAGTSAQLSVVGRFTDGTMQNVSEAVLWNSENPAVAQVSNTPGQRGFLQSLAPGATEVVAALGARTVRVSVTVTPATLVSLALTPAAVTLPLGATAEIVATGLFTDGSTQNLTGQVTWTSAAASIVAVDPATNPGRLSALSVGQAVIRAQLQSVTAQLTVNVTSAELRRIELTPSAPSLALGTSLRLTATGIYSDTTTQNLTTQATWSSDDGATVTVSNTSGTEGLLVATGQGITQVRTTFQGITAVLPVEVTAAVLVSLSVSQTQVSLPVGVETTLSIAGLYSDGSTQDLTTQATWSTVDAAIATASNAPGAHGRVRGVSIGSTVGTASFNGTSVTFSITVSPASLRGLALTPSITSVPRGYTLAFVATGSFSDGSTQDLSSQVSWSVSGPALAVSPLGLVTALDMGTADVIAREGSFEVRLTLVVTPAVLLSLSLTPAAPSAPRGLVVPFVATGTYSDGSTRDVTSQATWSSSNVTVATVSNASGSQGVARTLATGTTDVTATLSGESATTTLTVLPAVLDRIDVTPSTTRIAVGTTARFQATGRYTDGTTQDLTTQVTWSVSNVALASVANAAPAIGRVSALAAGSVQIEATRQGVTGAAALDIAALTLTAMAISPGAPSVPAGRGATLTVVGTFDDGSTQDLSDLVTWNSSDTATVTVSNAQGSEGLASALAVGTATVSATALGRTASITFSVTNALLTGLEVSPVTASLARGLTLDFAAMGRFSDGSTSDVTNQASWSSSDSAIVSISNASGSNGRATALALGSVTVTAFLSGRTATATASVTPAVLQQLQISPLSATVPRGLSSPFTVTGVYSDGTMNDLTGQVVWSSTASMTASVSNAPGTRGLVQALAVGSATITATLGSISGTRLITVTPAQLTSVRVGPAAPSVPRGLIAQLSATGLYTDGTTQDLTTTASWSSSDTNIATVSNAATTEGVARAMNQGVVTITATVGAHSGSVQVSVSAAVLQLLQVTPSMPSIASGLQLPLSATGVFSDSTTQDVTAQVVWTSSDELVATVSNVATMEGVVTARAAGNAVITASLSGTTGSTAVTVTPAVLQQLQVTPFNPSRPRGLDVQLSATGVFSDGSTQNLTTQVTWASANVNTVVISNMPSTEGLAHAQALGTTSVTATLSGITGSTPITVTAAELTRIDVTPTSLTVPLGTVRQFQALGRYTDGSTQNLTTQSTWSSSNTAVLDVSNAAGSEGLATTIGTGAAQVTVTFGAFTTVASLTITQAALAFIDLTPSSGTTPLGFTRQFIAIGTYTDGTSQVLTSQALWSSSDTTKALISNATNSRGLLSTVGVGTVTIEAVFNGITAITTHTVSSATLVNLTVTPSNVSVAQGATVPLSAVGSYSDGSTQDLTATVTWSSLAPGTAQVSNATGSAGLVTGVAAGIATVRAQSGAMIRSVTVTVTP
jgi:trimeric autotransporter adhesin